MFPGAGIPTLAPRQQLQRARIPRGTFTAHRAFGEAQAVLRGDGTAEVTRAVSRPLPAAGGAEKVWPSFGAPTGAQLFWVSDLREESPRDRAASSPSLCCTCPASVPPTLKVDSKVLQDEESADLVSSPTSEMSLNESPAICTRVSCFAERSGTALNDVM